MNNITEGEFTLPVVMEREKVIGWALPGYDRDKKQIIRSERAARIFAIRGSNICHDLDSSKFRVSAGW